MEGNASSSFIATQIAAVKNGYDGIWVSGTNMFFDRVVAQFNGGSVMNLLGSTGVSVSNLLATNNATGVTWFGGRAIGSTVTNATIAFNKNAEVACGTVPGGGKLVLVNSILWNTSGTTYSGTGCSFSYSDVAGGASGTKNINLDPFFVDPAKGDYHLSNTVSKKSPCINAGNSSATTLPKTDLDGANRASGVVDLGAYEAK